MLWVVDQFIKKKKRYPKLYDVTKIQVHEMNIIEKTKKEGRQGTDLI